MIGKIDQKDNLKFMEPMSRAKYQKRCSKAPSTMRDIMKPQNYPVASSIIETNINTYIDR